jgi:predicted murein hydrolase (TIGR00659 family)
MTDLSTIWVYLAANPLFHLTLTLAAYLAGYLIAKQAGFAPLLNPVLIAVAIVVCVLLLTGTSYQTYFQGAQFVHFLLGTATVALAIPLYRQWHRIRQFPVVLLSTIVAGSLIASLSAIALVWAFGGSAAAIVSVAPKSVTAPVAMGIAERLGGLPSMTAVLVILTGVTGAIVGPPLMNMLNVRDWAARGIAMGVASHGIGTARALQVNEKAGAFAGLAMGLNAVATSILLPPLWQLFGRFF